MDSETLQARLEEVRTAMRIDRRMEMRLFTGAICVLLLTHHAAAQALLKTIQDGALDRIELFVASRGPG
jgi:hypothetical protein